MKDWVTIADAKEIYGKSETTMRNLVRKLKASKSKKIKIEKTTNGREILLIKRSYLDSQYDISTDKVIDSVPDSVPDNDIVLFLKGQIEIKDKQIDQLSHLLHQEKENVKMLMLQSGSADETAKEKPQEVAKDGGAVGVIILVFIVLVALVWSILELY